MMSPAAGTLTGAGGVKLLASAGQMTVDWKHEVFGVQNIFQYLAKISIGILRIACTVNWFRLQAIHLAAYGVKIDVKVIDAKAWATENLYGILRARKAAAD